MFYVTTLGALIVERYAIVRLTTLARAPRAAVGAAHLPDQCRHHRQGERRARQDQAADLWHLWVTVSYVLSDLLAQQYSFESEP